MGLGALTRSCRWGKGRSSVPSELGVGDGTRAGWVGGRLVYGITTGWGAYSLLRGQLSWMTTRGWDVHLVADPDSRSWAASAREGVPLVALPMRRSISVISDLRSFVEWLILLRKLRPGVVNVGTPKAGLLGGMAAAILGVPRRVYVIRGLRIEGTRGLLCAVLWLTERLTISCATDVIVVSASVARRAQELRLLRRGRSWLIGDGSSNGVRTDGITQRVAEANPSLLRQEIGLTESDFVVGYVGRLADDKGTNTLLSAFALSAPDTKLLLVGPIEDEYLRTAMKGLGSRCVHVGLTDDAWRYYSVIDLFCLPTRREGFPNVVLEAAAAGIPTVTTKATGAIDSVIDGVTGFLVDVDDVSALAAVLTHASVHRDQLRMMGAAARRRCLESFSPERIWRGLDSILRGQPSADVRRI